MVKPYNYSAGTNGEVYVSNILVFYLVVDYH